MPYIYNLVSFHIFGFDVAFPLVTRYWFLIVYPSKVERPPYPTCYVPRVSGGSYSSISRPTVYDRYVSHPAIIHFPITNPQIGSSLLVAPVFVPLGEEHEYYLPCGKWTYFWNPSRVVQGPIWIKEHVPISEIPVWVREGSVLLLGPAGIGRPDYDYTQNLEIRIYEFDAARKESVEVEVPAGKGIEVAAKIRVEKGGKVEVVGGSAEIASQVFFG